ncbi:hypothetical protein SUGI_0938020 [Cryptomeria japonica]|nr:hypothetical protein SUGI_0938020 [Cryptomeria japonica]
MRQFGMHLRGPQMEGNTRPIIAMSPSFPVTPTSKRLGCDEKVNYCSKVLLHGCLVFPDVNRKQRSVLAYVQKNYDYCQHSRRPECPSQPPF